jgi:hypothetical protein
VLCLALAGVAMASEAEVYTVGDFAVNLAGMVTNKADYTPEQAAAYLKKVGVELGDLNAQVDEEIFASAFHRLGVDVVTRNPEAEVSSEKAGQVFQMFDRNDSLFSGEVFKVCSGGGSGTGEPHSCITDADCPGGGTCKTVESIKCKGGSLAGSACMSDAECPGGICSIPPGQLKKLIICSCVD